MADVVDVRPDQLSTIQAILAAHVPSAEVWAFGSRAKWTARDTSDLDLAVVSQDSISLNKLRGAFEESYLPFKVDVVDLARVSDEFRRVIEKQKVVLRRSTTSNGAGISSAGWTSLPLEECVETIIDYRGKTPRKVSSGIPLITAKVVKGGRIETPDEFIAPEDYDGWMRRGIPRAGDVLLTMEAPLGEVAQLDDRKVALAQRLVALRGKSGLLDNDFLKYLLQSKLIQDQLRSRASGTTVLGIKQSELRKIILIFPELAEQKAIAAMLGALDDKIELNRRMNATLQAMARALFQSWFVDFDPVRAKLDGRQPAGLDPATAALFPNEFEDSELGPIPRGWRVGSIYEIANVIYGAPFASSLFNTQKLGKPLIRIRDLPNESPAVFTTEVHPKGYLLKPGDIAVGMDGEFRAYLWAGVESWLNQRVCVFAPRPGYSAAFVRNSIFAPLAQVEATETATTVIHIGKNDIDRFTVVIPDAPVADAFKQQCQLWYDQIVANKQQSRTLATLRDTLLPKLLSGALSVDRLAA